MALGGSSGVLVQLDPNPEVLVRRLRDLLVDGILLTLPIVAAIVLLAKANQLLGKLLQPVAELTPPGRFFGIGLADVMVLLALMVSLLLLGAVARSAMGRRVSASLERSVLIRIPGFVMLKSVLSAWSHTEPANALRPALVALDDNTVLGLVVESNEASGMTTVFVPESPSGMSGLVMLVRSSRVTPLQTTTASALRAVRSFGIGLQGIQPVATRSAADIAH
jgi:uncharacterized membrane protein